MYWSRRWKVHNCKPCNYIGIANNAKNKVAEFKLDQINQVSEVETSLDSSKDSDIN